MLLDGFKFVLKYFRKNIYDKKRLCVNYFIVCFVVVIFIVRLGKIWFWFLLLYIFIFMVLICYIFNFKCRY